MIAINFRAKEEGKRWLLKFRPPPPLRRPLALLEQEWRCQLQWQWPEERENREQGKRWAGQGKEGRKDDGPGRTMDQGGAVKEGRKCYTR